MNKRIIYTKWDKNEGWDNRNYSFVTDDCYEFFDLFDELPFFDRDFVWVSPDGAIINIFDNDGWIVERYVIVDEIFTNEPYTDCVVSEILDCPGYLVYDSDDEHGSDLV